MKTKIKMLRDGVLVKELEEEDKVTESGIFVASGKKKNSDNKVGEVLGVGSNLLDKNIKKGQNVLYVSKNSKIEIGGEELEFVSEEDLLAIL